MRKRNSKGLRAAVIVLAVLLLAVGAIAIWQYARTNKAQDTASTADTSQADTSSDSSVAPADDSTAKPSDNSNTGDIPQIDPATVSTVEVEPMNLTVSYKKGTPGFEFNVIRTSGGTKYVQFSAPELVGTKCSNDVGAFASIIASPTANDATTLTTTKVVDDVVYGLSFATDTCTNKPELLATYQNAFSYAFSLLKHTTAI